MDNGYTTYSDCNYNFTGKKMNKLRKFLNWLVYGEWEDNYLELFEVYAIVCLWWVLLPFRVLTEIVNFSKKGDE